MCVNILAFAMPGSFEWIELVAIAMGIVGVVGGIVYVAARLMRNHDGFAKNTRPPGRAG